MNIYSKIEPTQILHIINRKRDIVDGRCDLVEPDQFIQCAALKLPHETTFKPHRHIMQSRHELYIPQESWVVISGLVKVILYDLDNTILHTDILEPGDCSITLQGGHNYELLADSVVYEFKTGPYQGQQHDKTFI
jgi:hypothetical protein